MASNITTLVEKAKQGDADAFSTLYQMYYPKMKGICINILREDKAVVDDIVQDAFILAFVSLKDLKNTHRFSQWLTSITTNLLYIIMSCSPTIMQANPILSDCSITEVT